MKSTTPKTERTREPKRLRELAHSYAVAEVRAMGVPWSDADSEILRAQAGLNHASVRATRHTYRGEAREVLANYASLVSGGWWWCGPDGLTARKLALLSILAGIPDFDEFCASAYGLGKRSPSAADAVADERKKLEPYAKNSRRGRVFSKKTAKGIASTS